jgi:N-acetylmuramoyl-L-alanine amidase
MPTEHVVKQGEHLTRIAKEHGFFDFRTIFDDPANADFKALRPNPDVIFPGDRIVIPDKQVKEQTGVTDRRHIFQVQTPTLKLRIKLTDIDHEPMPGIDCHLLVEGKVHPLTTDPDAIIEVEIPETAERGNLTFPDEKIPFDIDEVRIGHLDPVTEPSGQRARLNNLGYFLGDIDDPDDLELRSAIEEFQCDFMGKPAVDGICGPKTQAKLLEKHGC